MSPVMTVARFIVKDSKTPVSNLKVQKLLYYVQGWSLGIFGKPMFREPIQAWAHGPVVPEAFNALRHLGWKPIPIPVEALDITSESMDHIRNVLHAYGKFSASDLERLSHTEKPWRDARKDLPPGARSQKSITHTSLKEYFGGLVNGQKDK